VGIDSSILPAAVGCELILSVFLFCIARFYQQKFREITYYYLYLLPVAFFISSLIISIALDISTGWALVVTSATTLFILLTVGVFLYRKMMGATG
jgi:cytochrome bd-type quinol oxidase subunit 2